MPAFRAKVPGASADRHDHKISWAVGQIREVDDEMAAYHRAHTDAFVEVGGAVFAAVTATVVAVESGYGPSRRTTLTLTDLPQAVVNGVEYQGTKIYTFPEGRIQIHGVVASLAQKTTSAIAGTLNSGVTGSLGLGSVTASAVTLATTMVDLAPATAFVTSTVINVAAAAVNPVLAAPAQFDGHTTAIAMFLNSSYATTTDVDADATQTWTGTVEIAWSYIGDF